MTMPLEGSAKLPSAACLFGSKVTVSRFLFATMPIVGHVAPIAPVARELINRGHEVTWYTSKHFKDKITSTGATFAPLVSPIDFGDGEYNKHFPGETEQGALSADRSCDLPSRQPGVCRPS